MALTIYQGKQKLFVNLEWYPGNDFAPLQFGRGFYAQRSKDEKQSNKGGNSMKMKETLQIGKTEIPNAWQLTNKRSGITKEWEEADVYGQRQKKNEGKPTFVLHDGPHMPMVRFTWDTPKIRFRKDLSFVVNQ